MKWRASLLFPLLLAGCGQSPEESSSGKLVLNMWHSQKRQNEDALVAVVRRFNQSNPHYAVQPHNIGSYTALFHKVKTMVQGPGQLPDLCIAYESMVTELVPAGVVVALDDYLNHPDYGLSPEEQADIFPSFLSSNRYPDFGNRLLSFPFTKSLLMLYYNVELLRAAGHNQPPATWKEFIQQCRDVKAKSGQPAFAYSRDPSSFDGMILSLGGKLATEDGARSNLGSPEALRALEIIHTLVQEELAVKLTPGSDLDRTLFANQKVAFILRSSTTRAYMRKDILDEQGRDRFEWSMACPPVGEGRPKLTVLYGGNICVFKSTPERQRGAWEFIKFFTSPEITAEWATKTGYLPVRRSAAKTKALQGFFARHPRNRVVFDTIPYGAREPNVAGWQAVRDYIAQALTRVCTGRYTAANAAAALAHDADAELARRARIRLDRPAGGGAAFVVVLVLVGVVTLVLALALRRGKAAKASDS